MTWETVIGLEVHARLQTSSKLFCSCPAAYGAPPNTQVCPVCLGYPGALPVLNRGAVQLAVRAALATGCTIHRDSLFARKNYFYPDLPKGYQISQYDQPLASGGSVPARVSGETREFRLIRIHMEEDAGKLMHDSAAGRSLVDLNRAGVPLIEIVSEPGMRSAEEAVAFFTRLRQILMYTSVCDGNMEEGSLRCDANVSVRRAGSPQLGTRTEVKNLNSFRFLSRAIEFETRRQIEILTSGGQVEQETRLFDPAAGETRPMRMKEESHDYRYFPEPDLFRLRVSGALLDEQRSRIPPLPHELADRWFAEHGIPLRDGEVLAATREVAEYFAATAAASGNWKGAANWVRNEVLGWTSDVGAFPLRPEALGRLVVLIDSGAISGKAAKEVFEEIASSGGDPDQIVARRSLAQISDPSMIRRAAESVLAAHAVQVEQYRAGKKGLFGFFVGQLLRETGGKANPELASSLLRELLDG
jgi:aspartyl-tRNA(Asn)/glutamyl-tRNA(Gln) amidotransferase subunit B